MSDRTATSVVVALALVTGRPQETCERPDAVLEHELGVDSLALLEVVETLQERLGIAVPDEVTARVRTVADLQDAVRSLVTASATTPPKDTSS
ncbi:acyl carrier protein [Streptomyces paludis]|uniref:acyl carrier protein n=1 Tax=Streptomyces paludis TaxID=2282738 RepID=UPI0013B3BD88|nr:acyl carrier protein [Streptomyces paludis]